MHKYIKDLAQSGIKVFPCNDDKTPITSTGFHAATDDINKLERMFYRDDLLIGLPTGNISNIVVIDIDVNKTLPGSDEIDTRTVDELKEELENILGEKLPETIEVESKSGGRHLYFKTKFTQLNSSTRFFDKTLPIDVRSSGGYIIFADDDKYVFHDNFDEAIAVNFIDKIAPLPEVVENYKQSSLNSTVETPLENDPLSENEIREIRSALSFLSSDDRDFWIRVGMILKSTGSKAAYGLWNEFSKTSSKYTPDDMEKRWKGLKPTEIELGSLFFEAKKSGWTTTYKPIEAETPQIQINLGGLALKKKPEKPKMDKDLLNPPGLVGELMDYIQVCSIKSQPIFALASSICAIGALQGRKIISDGKVKTNIYCMGVGASGCGKDSPRQAIKRCFEAIGASEMCSVEDLASDASIVTELSKVGLESQLFLLDEIGRFLKTTGEQKNSHLFLIVSVLLKLYTSSNDVYYGKSYADETKRKKIVHPNLCLYGTTVPESLYRGLTIDHLQNGFLSRMLIFESDEDPRKKRRKNRRATDPPGRLLDQLSLWKTKALNPHPAGNMGHMLLVPEIVYMNDGAVEIVENYDDYLHDFKDTVPDEFRSIYGRTSEIAEKIALIVAAGRNFKNPIIEESDILYGINLTRYLADYLFYVAQNFMADSNYEHELKNILAIIRETGKIQKTFLTQKTQKLQSHLRNDILETLKDSGQIVENLEGDGVKKTSFFYAV